MRKKKVKLKNKRIGGRVVNEITLDELKKWSYKKDNFLAYENINDPIEYLTFIDRETGNAIPIPYNYELIGSIR